MMCMSVVSNSYGWLGVGRDGGGGLLACGTKPGAVGHMSGVRGEDTDNTVFQVCRAGVLVKAVCCAFPVWCKCFINALYPSS